MGGWNYPQSNAQAGPSKSSNPALDRSRQSTNVTYTHWSQQHLEANPDAGFELFAGLMHMSGSHEPPPPIPRSAFRNNNHGEARPTDSTYSVLSNSTRNTDYTLGTPYSTISSSSSSAYPVANTIPDIPLTSWMLPPDNKDQSTLPGSTSYRNGFSITSNQHGPSRAQSSQSSLDHASSTTHHLPSALKQTTSSGSISTVSAFAPLPSNNGFRIPTQRNIPIAEHIRRDGHLPSTLYPHARFGFEEGEIMDEARFDDPPSALKTNAASRSDNIWDFPRRPNTLSNHQFAKPYTLAQNQGKGKEKEAAVPHPGNGGRQATRWDESSESSEYDDEAEAQDGYMRNCEPMIKNDKRRYKSMNLLGSSPAPRQTSAAPSQSEHDAGSQTTKRRRDKSVTSEGPAYGLESATGRLRTDHHSQPPDDHDSEGVTDQPCKTGERQRMAFIELPQPFPRNPKRREAYIFLDIPPIPTKSLRKAAIVARERTIGGVLTGLESLDEAVEEVESEESEEEPEVVIEGDKFLTVDKEKDVQRDTCHQCQEVSKEAKMSCCNTEVECSLRYCQSCVEERYNFHFDAESRLFICPVCQGYCNCAPCLDKSKLVEKLHLAEIMDGSAEEFRRILNKYKNVQLFLEAMGASRAPPVPRTIIHGIRIVRKAEDTLSRPIPQDVYHQLMQPGKMEVTYRSMISLAGPIKWAFPKATANKKRKAHKTAAQDGYLDDGGEEDSDSDFDEARERKRSKPNKKKSRHAPVLPNPALSAIPFQFAVDSTGEPLIGNDGCPVINPLAYPQAKFSSTKRNGKKQVTFSADLEAASGEMQYGAYNSHAEPQRLAAEAMEQAVQYLQRQLQQQRRHSTDPDANPDFRLDPGLAEFLNEDPEAGQMAKQIMESSEFPEDEDASVEPQLNTQTLAELNAAAMSAEGPPNDQQQDTPAGHQTANSNTTIGQEEEPFNSNLEDNTFDSVLARVQHFQNGPLDSELDAIFDVFTHNGADEGQDEPTYDGAEEGSDERTFDISMETVCMASGEV